VPLSLVTGDGDPHRRQESDGGAWSKRAATIPVVPEASNTTPDSILAPDSILGPPFVNSNCLMCCLDYFGLCLFCNNM